MESHVSMPNVSVPTLTATRIASSGAHLTTTASVSTPRVSSTVSSRVLPTATLSNPDTLWIQNSAGHFVPVNADNLPSSGLHYQFTDVGDDHSLLPDNYNPVQDILTSVPADSIQTAGVVESEADSDAESNVETDQYLAPIGQIYELMFRTLGEDYCPRPAELSSNATISVTEQLFRTFDPNRVIKSTARPDPRLPIGSTVLSVLQSLESANKTIPKRGETWKIPKELADPKHQEGSKSYKPPVPHATSGLDFSKLPVPDPDISKLSLVMPSGSNSVSVPFSMLETWEMRERRSLGLTNQIDFMLATILQMVCDWSESVPEELRDLLIHLSRTTLALSHTSASSMSEMLRIRRDLILTSLPKDFLLEPGMNSLRTAPLTSGFLFGGRIQEAITADKDDQLHASLARNNSGQRQGVFKHPASRPPAVPAFKTAKRNNLFSKKPSFNPRSGPNRQSSYNRPSLSHKSSNKDSGKKGKPKPGQRNFKPSTGRGAPPAYQP